MGWEGWLSLSLTVGVLVTLMLTRLPPYLVVMAVLTVFSALGILTPAEALAGFSNQGLITVAAMFIVAAGINASGGVDLLVNHILGKPKTERRAMARMFIPVVGLSGFLNNTPLVSTMLPAVMAWSKKIDIPASKLLIPLSYASMLGGTLTMIGTSTNLVTNGQYEVLTGKEGFSLFSITLLGIPVAIAGILTIIFLFPRILPNRKENLPFSNLREFTLEVQIAHDGPLVGKTVEGAGLRNLKRLYLVEIERGGNIVTAVPSEERLQGGDRLVFAGDTEAISDLLRINGIVPSADNEEAILTKSREERRLVEAVVSQHCAVIGQEIRDARFRDRYGAVVLAVARNGERVKGNLSNIRLEAGDTLLLEARPAFVSRQRYNKDFLLINDLDTEAPHHEKALLSWGILLAIIIAAGCGLTSMLNAALLGAGVMLAMGCCSISQAEKSLDIPVIITIAASFALGAAMQKTGVATFLANNIIELGDGRPWLMLILVYVTVSILTEIISNNASAILVLPIALGITQSLGLNEEPFVFAIMVAASSSFATPLSYQTNLMVYGPGGYTMMDFLKAGLPMNLVVGATCITTLLLFWPLEATI